MSTRYLVAQQLGSTLRLPFADLERLNEVFGCAQLNGVESIVLNPCSEHPLVFVPEREVCSMEPVKDYKVSKCATSWGCVCSSCGGFHEFTHGKGWRFCPSCGKRIVWEVDE